MRLIRWHIFPPAWLFGLIPTRWLSWTTTLVLETYQVLKILVEEMSTVHLGYCSQWLIVLILNYYVYRSNLILLGFSLHPLDCTITFCLCSNRVQVSTGLGKYLVRPESYNSKLWFLRDLALVVTDKEQLHIAQCFNPFLIPCIYLLSL